MTGSTGIPGKGLLISAMAVSCIGCGRAAPASRFPDAEAALARMKASYACVNGIKADATIDRRVQGKRLRVSTTVFAVNPARLRIDVHAPVSGIVSTLTSNGQQFALLNMTQSHFMSGPASPCNLARMTHVPVPGHVLTTLLRGEAPLLAHKPRAATLRWDDEGHYVVDIRGRRAAQQQLWLEVDEQSEQLPWHKQRVRVTHVAAQQRGKALYTVDMRHHRRTVTAPPRQGALGAPDIPPSGGTCRASVPRSFHVQVPASGDDVIIQYKEAALNPPLLRQMFWQSQPAGTRHTFVNCASPKSAKHP